jgi:hypothetical protein
MLDLKFPSNKQAQAKKIKSSIFLLSRLLAVAGCQEEEDNRQQPTMTEEEEHLL